MPTTARIAITLTDPESSTEENVDSVTSSEGGRHERWTIPGGVGEIRMYWPLSGELNVFLQVWQPQPALDTTIFTLRFPGTDGWSCAIPRVGRVPMMFRVPYGTDIIEAIADPFSVEVDAMYF